MKFRTFQEAARQTDQRPGTDLADIAVHLLGLVGEAGLGRHGVQEAAPRRPRAHGIQGAHPRGARRCAVVHRDPRQ